MRIAQACFRFAAPGGAEEHVMQISRELVRRGHEVVVHTSDILTETPWVRGEWQAGRGGADGAGSLDGIEVVRHRAYIRPLSRRWSTLVIPDMVSGLLGERCDIYHAHSHRYFQLEAAASAARARGRPLVVTPHYHPAERREGARTRVLLKLYDLYSSAGIYSWASRVLTMTELEKKYLSSIVPATKCTTIGTGIDPGEWEEAPDPSLFRERCGVEGPYILYSGRLASNKGLETLFGALPDIFRGWNGQLVLVGKDWGMRKRLEEAARRGGFEGRVRFIDFLPEREIYRAAIAGCELLVLPSEWEAFGIVLLEAAMCRRPVVATAVGGVPEVVQDGTTGILVPYGETRALSDAVTALLSDPARGARMGERARELVLERYTWPKVVDRILGVYKEILG
ncbi:MAG: glycosyltransferase family 4 protein [Thermoplasmata archaeon]